MHKSYVRIHLEFRQLLDEWGYDFTASQRRDRALDDHEVSLSQMGSDGLNRCRHRAKICDLSSLLQGGWNRDDEDVAIFHCLRSDEIVSNCLLFENLFDFPFLNGEVTRIDSAHNFLPDVHSGHFETRSSQDAG